jgi:hypothetical protein
VEYSVQDWTQVIGSKLVDLIGKSMNKRAIRVREEAAICKSSSSRLQGTRNKQWYKRHAVELRGDKGRRVENALNLATQFWILLKLNGEGRGEVMDEGLGGCVS